MLHGHKPNAQITVRNARYSRNGFRAANVRNTGYVRTLHGRVLQYKYLWALDLSDFPTRSDFKWGGRHKKNKKRNMPQIGRFQGTPL